MNKIKYRSPGLPVGVFNRPGVIHLHIDGAESLDQVVEIVKAMEANGNPGCLDYVLESAVGPQRRQEPETYMAHTPVFGGEEAFDFFASILAKDRSDATLLVNRVVQTLSSTTGAIIELEQNVSWTCGPATNMITPSYEQAIIEDSEVLLEPKKTLRYEIHHALEVPKEQGRLDIHQLSRYCEQSGVLFGGWFMFEDDNVFSYWSNCFSSTRGLREQVEREQKILQQFVSDSNLALVPCTLVERVLGIWHSQA